MGKSSIVHGLLQDVIDYKALIENQSSVPVSRPCRVTKARKSKYGRPKRSKFTSKGFSKRLARR